MEGLIEIDILLEQNKREKDVLREKREILVPIICDQLRTEYPIAYVVASKKNGAWCSPIFARETVAVDYLRCNFNEKEYRIEMIKTDKLINSILINFVK